MRYDCDFIVAATDGRHFQCESLVAAENVSLAIALVQSYANGHHPGSRIEQIFLDELSEDHPWQTWDTPRDGVYTNGDFVEVVKGSTDGLLKRWWNALLNRRGKSD